MRPLVFGVVMALALASSASAASAQTGPPIGPGGSQALPEELFRGGAYGREVIAPPAGAATGGGASTGAGAGLPFSGPTGLFSAQDCRSGWRPVLGVSREEFVNACQNR